MGEFAAALGIGAEAAGTAAEAGGAAATAAEAGAYAGTAATALDISAAPSLAFTIAPTAATGGTAAGTTAGFWSSVGAASPYLTAASSAISGIGALATGAAGSDAARYQAAVAGNNAILANQNAEMTRAAGEQQAAISGQATKAKVGSILASQAASNVDVNSGSAVDVRSSAAALGELNALTIRSNAEKTAYGYQTQGQGFTAQSQLDKMTASNISAAAPLNATGSLLSGASGAAKAYQEWQTSAGSPAAGNPTGVYDPTTGLGQAQWGGP